MGIMDWLGSDNYTDLMKLEEPYAYRELLTVPKLIINATGDEFFVPDSSQFYFHDLRGPKYLRYVPNADHCLEGTDAFETLGGFFYTIVRKEPLPEISWRFDGDGGVIVHADPRPLTVTLWQATNPDARDFRVETLGKVWTSKDLVPEADGSYIGKVATPQKGWTAYMVELTFPCKNGVERIKLSTEVKIIPDILPHKFKSRRKAAP
jgi:PhoPQ-activated pathogenicity-related protein